MPDEDIIDKVKHPRVFVDGKYKQREIVREKKKEKK